MDPRPRTPHVARCERAGFTLLELIVVMGVIGVVAGVGLGFFATFDPGRRTALGLVQNTLRAAQNSAVARQAPAAVRFDVANGRMRAEAFEVAGTWHFETPGLEGADGVDGEPLDFPGEFLADDGFTGRALDLAKGTPRSRVAIDVDSDPVFEPRRGFGIDVALRAEDVRPALLLDLGGVVKLSVRRDGGVEGRVLTRREDELGRPVPGAEIALRSAPGVLRPGRWTRVRLTYDRRALRLFADDVPLVLRAEDRELWDLEGPLVLGDPREIWPGQLDQLVLSTVTADEEFELPRTVSFDPRTPPVVRFAQGGALDAAEHFGPVRFGLVFEDGSVADVLVNTFGTVE